jgi:diguanylate cyclase (GGDEF)-like protein
MQLSVESVGMAETRTGALAEIGRLASSGWPRRAYDAAVRLLETAGPDETLGAEICDCLADCCLKMARYELGIGYARRAAGVWQARGETARLAGSLALMAEFFADIGAPDAVETAARAMNLADASAAPAAIARAQMTMGLVLFMAREPDKALPFCERAVAISREAELSFPVAMINLAEAIMLSGAQAGLRGDHATLAAAVARAVDLSREALAQARAAGDGWLERLALNNIADYSLRIGDVATAAAALAEVPAAAGEPTVRCQSQHFVARAKLLAAQGDLAGAERDLEACLAVLAEADYLEIEVMCHGELANVLERMGRFAEALAAHRRFHAGFERMASEGAQRLARMAAHETETRALRDAAGQAQSLAASLVRTNAALAREAERLARVSRQDDLTGLPNRRQLEMVLQELGAGGTPYALAMLDVDFFKQINDSFSHAVGDAVLRKIGWIFARLARRSDLVVRYGGEEFALVLRTADAGLVARVCERLRAGVEAANWAAVQDGLAVTVSVGIALSKEADGPAAVLRLADARLYEAKGHGRNCVVGPEVATRAGRKAVK